MYKVEVSLAVNVNVNCIVEGRVLDAWMYASKYITVGGDPVLPKIITRKPIRSLRHRREQIIHSRLQKGYKIHVWMYVKSLCIDC